MRVLVTDGDQRSALAAVRSLQRAGMHVIVGETHRPSLAGVSRSCAETVVYPRPSEHERRFVETVVEAVRALRIDLVIPTADLASAVLSEHKGELEPDTVVAVVDSERFWAASDKNRLHRLADRLEVPTPTLHYVDSADEGVRWAGSLPYPCIVKPSRSQLRLDGRWIHTSVRRANSTGQLEAMFRDRVELQHPCMLQREIHGEAVGVFALCKEGEPLALFGHRRLREKPPWGGVSTLRESVALDPEIERLATRLLHGLRWHGVAMVEFKRDRATGVPYLMEVNGRLWGSLQLAIDAGIDFPKLLVELYMGRDVAPVRAYRTGIRSRWLLGDLDHLVTRLSKRPPPGVKLPPLTSVLRDFLLPYRRGTRLEIERWHDMRPAWYELRRYVRDLLRSVGGAFAGAMSRSTHRRAARNVETGLASEAGTKGSR